MTWIKKIAGRVSRWFGGQMGHAWMDSNGWVEYNGSLPDDRLDIVDGVVVELPEPEPVNKYAEWYTANPDLVPRVREYALALSGLGLSYTATTDEIGAAINSLEVAESVKIGKILQMQTAFSNIVLNLEYLGVDRPQFTAWSEMPQMIANLPEA